jgi:hypothetical protein
MSNEIRTTPALNQARDRLRLEHWPVERLVPSARNARTHTDAQVAEIAGSIRAFGFTNPILAGEDGDVIEPTRCFTFGSKFHCMRRQNTRAPRLRPNLSQLGTFSQILLREQPHAACCCIVDFRNSACCLFRQQQG